MGENISLGVSLSENLSEEKISGILERFETKKVGVSDYREELYARERCYRSIAGGLDFSVLDGIQQEKYYSMPEIHLGVERSWVRAIDGVFFYRKDEHGKRDDKYKPLTEYTSAGEITIKTAEAIFEEVSETALYGVLRTDYEGYPTRSIEAHGIRTEAYGIYCGSLPPIFEYFCFPWMVFYSSRVFTKQALDLIENAPAYKINDYSGGKLLIASPVPPHHTIHSWNVEELETLGAPEEIVELAERLAKDGENATKLSAYFQKHKILEKLRESR